MAWHEPVNSPALIKQDCIHRVQELRASLHRRMVAVRGTVVRVGGLEVTTAWLAWQWWRKAPQADRLALLVTE